MTKHSLGVQSRLHMISRANPAAIAAFAYAGYIFLGAVLLWLPFSKDAARTDAVMFVDALFISASAVSTTGLTTLDTASTFSFAGELIVLVLLQIGGIGYMTFMSFAYIGLQNRLGPTQRRLNRSGFGLNADFDMTRFVKRVVLYTATLEIAGAAILSVLFMQAGIQDPVWQAIFHAVSAFCTAGFSLFATSLEEFRANSGILLTISALSYLGAIGFIVISEIHDRIMKGCPVSITSKLILKVTAGLAFGGTLFMYWFEPSVQTLPESQRWLNAFFQTMTASTTVGFNSLPISTLAPATIIVIYLLMFVGASPSGTGGGLKSTTVATLAAMVFDVLRGHKEVVSHGITIPAQRVQQAAATLCIGLTVMFMATVLLDVTGQYPFDKALFEVISALATVGLSMGLTGELNTAGKLIITMVMYIGRVGILAFFAAFALVGAEHDSHLNQPLPEKDVIL
jgi:trk system potassium uptake protein TrkH